MKKEPTLIMAELEKQGYRFVPASKPYKSPKEKWMRAFQKYCDSDQIREESGINGINACGYGVQCDFCEGSEKRLACAKAMIEFANQNGVKINYEDDTIDSFRYLLLREFKENNQ